MNTCPCPNCAHERAEREGAEVALADHQHCADEETALRRILELARTNATAARARGDADEERRWIDALIVGETALGIETTR
ncbi:hypothetical protein PQD13_gp26 [Gordonia phage Clawz]|uniref:Uncharacterized protein n=1 Tax=Gordonia phage Clawz TaxID=2743910 RepID=A0AAE7F8S7_9CAUD|nr:hypothetical protein PQD13_gp26 [Gordonia phage Clawz]QKY79938.1 hypothetical protein SEA_CLAWZ_26 [Gordonia phage Clawz]